MKSKTIGKAVAFSLIIALAVGVFWSCVVNEDADSDNGDFEE
jgi:hypothetical protein